MSDKPLFIPLKGCYFDSFADGSKRTEYRLHGPRWNFSTCYMGRPVILSRGYGKQRRLHGVITGVSVAYNPTQNVPSAAWWAIYGGKGDAICIDIEVQPDSGRGDGA